FLEDRAAHAADLGRRIVTRSCAGHVTSRSVSGTPGRTTLARNRFAPCIAVGGVSTSPSKPSAVKRSPIWRSIGKTDAEAASGSLEAGAVAEGCSPSAALRFIRSPDPPAPAATAEDGSIYDL